MKGKQRFWLLAAIGVVLMMAAAACGGGEEATPIVVEKVKEVPVEVVKEVPVEVVKTVVVEKEVPVVAKPRRGGTLVVATTTDVPNLDIQRYLASGQHNALLPLYNGLVEKDWTVDAEFPPIIPALATSWDRSDDGKTYTFFLRRGVKFHDGTPWNAEAANFNFQRMTNPDHPNYDAQVGGSATGVLKGLKGSKVVDEFTFQLELDEPNAGLIDALASLANYYMISPTAFERYGNEGVGQRGVGTGPFKLVEWEKDVRMVMERNEDYWGKKPFVDRLIYRIIAEPVARVAALQRGEVQIAYDIPPDSVKTLQDDPDIQVWLRGLPATKVIECWQAEGPFSDKRVRQAVNMAIDRVTLADVILQGTALPATQMYGLGSASFDKSLPIFAEYDPEGAKALLAQAGHSDLEFTVFAAPQNEPVAGAVQAYEFVQANLRDIGVKMNIRNMEVNEWVGMYVKGPKETDECVGFDRGYDTDFILDMGYYGGQCVTTGGLNNQCYNNPEVNRLMEQAFTARSLEQWRELHKQAQRVLVEDFGSIPLVHGLRPIAAAANVAGWVPSRAWIQFPGYAWFTE